MCSKKCAKPVRPGSYSSREPVRTTVQYAASPSLGMRVSGGNDYDVIESGYGCEGRFWFLKGKGMSGPFMSLRFDTGLSRVADAGDGRVLGSNMRFGESFNTGVRFVFFDRLEATFSVGLGIRTDVDPRGRLSPWTRAELLRFGLTLGALF